MIVEAPWPRADVALPDRTLSVRHAPGLTEGLPSAVYVHGLGGSALNWTDLMGLRMAASPGIFVRIFKKHSGVASVTFEDVLDEGLCFGWSESLRLSGDDASYLQKFTPRRTPGTVSERNRRHVERLIREGRMTSAGLEALKGRVAPARRSRTTP